MGKASSSKKVARAAGTGGGRTNRGKTPVLWYGTLLLVLLLGVGLTAFSRDSRMEELGSPDSKEEPRANDTHWHVAMGVRVCDRWLDPATDQADPKGVHSHGDGIIHVHPFVASAAGKRATLQRYAEAVKGDLEANRFSWPVGDGKKKETKETGDKCGDQEGEVKAFYNGQPHEGDPGEIRFTDRGKLVLAFVPKGTTYEQIGDPPSTSGLDNLSDVDPSEKQQSQQVPPGAPGVEGAPPGGAPHVDEPGAAPHNDGVTPPVGIGPGASTPPASAAPGATAPPASAAPPTAAPPAPAPG